jgi:hypothetical protein
LIGSRSLKQLFKSCSQSVNISNRLVDWRWAPSVGKQTSGRLHSFGRFVVQCANKNVSNEREEQAAAEKNCAILVTFFSIVAGHKSMDGEADGGLFSSPFY